MTRTRGVEGRSPDRERKIRKIDEIGLEHIKKWEGLRTKAYRDAGGTWTIGYGHTSAAGTPQVREGMVISKIQADEILARDLAYFEAAVARNVKVALNDSQFAALVSFCYNVGEAAFKRSNLLKKLNQGDYEAVPAELGKWVYAKGKRVQGLVNRRAAEAGLWVKGAFVASNGAPCLPVAENPYLKPELVAPGLGAAAGLSGFVSGQGPFQWALAFVMVVGFLLGSWYFVRRVREGNS